MKLEDELQKEYDRMILNCGGCENLETANRIYNLANEKKIELKLSSESLRAFKKEYETQLIAEIRGHTYSLGWEGCPQIIENFAKGKNELELLLKETLKEVYNNKDNG